MAKKKDELEFIDDIGVPLTFAGGAIGASVLGSGFDDFIPVGMTNPLTTTGTTMARFQAPVTTVAAGGIVFKQFKKLENKEMKGGKK